MLIVQCIEHLRDGTEYSAKLVVSKEEAIEVIEKWANGFGGDNLEFHLYEIGKEIPTEIETKRKAKPVEYEVKRVAKVSSNGTKAKRRV